MTSSGTTTGSPDHPDASGMIYQRSPFGVTTAGEQIERWVMDDGTLRVSVLTYGGIVQALEVPAGSVGPEVGERVDVVLGFDELAGYEATKSFMGALIGRVANRLTNSRFTLDGQDYEVTANEPPNSLHGGVDGFNRRVWSAEPYSQGGLAGLRMGLTSPDGDQGYPGELTVTVDYLLIPGGTLRIRYAATTSRPTPVNLTQHSYFNLGGTSPAPGSLTLDGHTLQVASGHYTPVDRALLPSGEIAHVVGTPFDLRTPKHLDFLNVDHNLVLDEQVDAEVEAAAGTGAGAGHGHGHGHDSHGHDDHGEGHDAGGHDDGPGLHFAARLLHVASGRSLSIATSEPAIQVYTGGKLDGTDIGKGGVAHTANAGCALETQDFPDAPNHEGFGSIVLRPGEQYLAVTDWTFSA